MLAEWQHFPLLLAHLAASLSMCFLMVSSVAIWSILEMSMVLVISYNARGSYETQLFIDLMLNTIKLKKDQPRPKGVHILLTIKLMLQQTFV